MKNYISAFYRKIVTMCKSKKWHDDSIAVAPNPDCSEFEADNWVISDFIVKQLIPIVGIRPYPVNELSLMVAAMCRFNPRYVFEWGTNRGVSCRIFYETMERFDIATEIHTIDLPDDIQHIEHPGNQRGALVKGLKNVHLHVGDGLSKSFEILQNLNLQDGAKIMFFLDGDHEYNSVRRELEAIIKNYPGAVILVHDTFYQSEKSLYNTGPFRAIADVLLTVPSDCYRKLSQDMGLPGMTLIYRG